MALDVEIAHVAGDFRLDVAFSLETRGVVALFGPSGSGKSTTINAIAGLIRPQRGRIVVGGRVLTDTARRIFLPPRRRRIGYVFQDARLFPHMSVRSNLMFGWRRSASPPPKAEVERLIDLLGIGHLLDRRPRHLSGGERSRVALGRAILCAPDLLLLDEPMASLDRARREEILPYLDRLRVETTTPMVYVSHSIEEVTRLADTMVVLDHGRVAAVGDVGTVTTRLDLFPITGRLDAAAVVEARIAEAVPGGEMSVLEFDGGRLLVPGYAGPPGVSVRTRIAARDVILSLAEPGEISANNVLQVTIAEIRREDGPYTEILLTAGPTRLIARVTHSSVERLRLAPGLRLFAVIKAINVDSRIRATAV